KMRYKFKICMMKFYEGGSWILTSSLLTCALSSLKNGCLSCLLLLRSSKPLLCIWTISILNTLCCLMTFPKEHSIFRLHILFCRITSLRKKVGPHEKLPWAQSVIRKGFTALEKLLKDHAGRYATEDEIFL
ncbi:hypothetical protein S83_019393, partial [Arachis hypogaea]